MKNEGISNGSTYSYEGIQALCRTSSYPPVVNISNFCEIDVEDDEVNLKKLVGTVGPVAAVITATDAFFNYGKGVFYDPTCISDAFDHAIVRFVKVLNYLHLLKKIIQVIVGYGTHRKHGDYWIIRNSWGDDDYKRKKDFDCSIIISSRRKLGPAGIRFDSSQSQQYCMRPRQVRNVSRQMLSNNKRKSRNARLFTLKKLSAFA